MKICLPYLLRLLDASATSAIPLEFSILPYFSRQMVESCSEKSTLPLDFSASSLSKHIRSRRSLRLSSSDSTHWFLSSRPPLYPQFSSTALVHRDVFPRVLSDTERLNVYTAFYVFSSAEYDTSRLRTKRMIDLFRAVRVFAYRSALYSASLYLSAMILLRYS